MEYSKLKNSIDRLLSRDDVRLSREQIEGYVNSGQWSEESFVDYLESHAENTPNKVAIIDEDGKKVTYAEYHQQTDQIAQALLGLGIKPGERIAIQLPNYSEFILLLMGAAKASIIPVMCHMPYTENDLDYVLELTRPKAVIIPDHFKNKNYVELLKNIQRRHSYLEHIMVVSEDRHEGTISFHDMTDKALFTPEFNLNDFRPVGTDPFAITFTSGTTGRPKAIMHLHANNLFWMKKLNPIWEFPEEGKWLIVTPMAHLTGLALGAWRSLYRGDTVTLLSTWNVKKAIELIEITKSSHFAGVAPMLIDLARYEGLENRDLRSLRGIVYAGAPCPIDILQTLNHRLGCKIYSNYGYSEGPVTHFTLSEDDLEISSTRFGKAADWIETKIIDESGKELQAPCEGEILVRGANFIPGYYGQQENNIKMFDAEGWFHSADIVRIDKNGYGTFLARKDDIINRGGYKIDPREIEELLFTHPLISQAVVVAMPDERLGERIAAFIIIKENAKFLTLKEIVDFLLEKGLGKEYCPEAIKIVDSLPINASGKIQRFVLRQQAKEISLNT